MKNELKLFTNEIFGEVQAINIDEKVWFVANDVAKLLGYVKPNNAVNAHCQSTLKWGIPHPQSPDKQIEVNIINEYDVIRLIMKSKLPQAQEFEKWVIEEVIPSVLSTGEYSIKPQPKTERELASESMYDLIMGNLTTNKSRTEALQIVVNHTKTIGKSEVCNDGTITIPGVKKFVIKHYGDILMQYNTFLSDQFVEFNRFLAYKQYLEGKRFRRKSGVGLEKKAIYQPTPLFHDNFVAQGFAQVRVIDDRGKMEITYTKDIEKYIVSESFKIEFLKYLGINLPQEVKQIA